MLELLIALSNQHHTAKHKEVSFKTRQERADFLRRFFRDLKDKAGFKTLPDPRNLGERHIKASVAVWQREGLAPATNQTYLSFLRGLANWIVKPGLVRQPYYYGLQPEEYQRHEAAQRDKSWSAQGIDIDCLIGEICRSLYDAFRKCGSSPAEFILAECLELCRRTLTSRIATQQTVTEIAFAHGFSDSAHFSRVFRSRYGTSPSELRRQMQDQATLVKLNE